MSVWEVVLIGVALSMDAFAITIANCATYKDTLNRKKEWAMPVAFAIFQILMPIIGYYIGSLFAEYISSAAKYVTAAIFFVLAAKIVIDNVKEARKEETEEKRRKLYSWHNHPASGGDQYRRVGGRRYFRRRTRIFRIRRRGNYRRGNVHPGYCGALYRQVLGRSFRKIRAVDGSVHSFLPCG